MLTMAATMFGRWGVAPSDRDVAGSAGGFAQMRSNTLVDLGTLGATEAWPGINGRSRGWFAETATDDHAFVY